MQKLQSNLYRNWVKGALGLGYLQEGLFPFTNDVVKAEHAVIISSKTYTPCGSCSKAPKKKGKCNCQGKKNTICSCCKFYDDIISQHRFKDPHWVPDCSTWCNDHWQFAKCFLTTTTEDSNKTAKDTDASGLLSIIINCKFFETKLQCTINAQNDIFSEVRKMRNEILHNSTLQLNDQDVTRYLHSMIKVLEISKVLCSDPAAQAALKKLREILKTTLHINTDDEAKAIQTALDAINEANGQAKESIGKKTEIAVKTIDAAKEEAIAGVSSTLSTVFEETYNPKLKNIETTLQYHDARISQNKEELQKLTERVAELEELRKKHQTRMDYLNQVKELQNHLVDQYERHNVKTWISPLMTKENVVNIRNVYVPPRMVVEDKKDDKEGKKTGTEKRQGGGE